MEGYLSEIRMFAGNFPPRGWLFCQGQLISIAEWTAVFALVGTTYGGDGQVTFGIPDLRSRVPMGTGQGPGLGSVVLGQMAGAESTTLLVSNLPAHNHPITISAVRPCKNGAGSADTPSANIPASSAADEIFAAPAAANATMPVNSSISTGIAGSSQPFSGLQPYLSMNYIICMEGIFPSRN